MQNNTKKEKNYTDVIYSSNAMCSLSSGLRHAVLRSNKLFLNLGSNKSVFTTRVCFYTERKVLSRCFIFVLQHHNFFLANALFLKKVRLADLKLINFKNVGWKFCYGINFTKLLEEDNDLSGWPLSGSRNT